MTSRAFISCLSICLLGGLGTILTAECCHGAQQELIWNRDPFVLPQDHDRSPSWVSFVKCSLKLNGLMPGDNPQAFIGDGVYGLGDGINEYRLTQITTDSVILKNKSKSEQCVLKIEP